MSRSKNNTDKLVDLLFYVFPQCIDEHTDHKHGKRHHKEREDLSDEEKREIYKKIKSLALNNNRHNVKKGCIECDMKEAEGKQQIGANNNCKYSIEERNATDNDHEYKKSNKNRTFNLNNKERISEKKAYNNPTSSDQIYNNEFQIKKVIKVLINKKVNIAISDAARSIVWNVIILEINRDTVKLKTEKNTIIVLSIKEIVAIQCNKEDYNKFIKSICFNQKEHYSKKELEKYFYSIIGKKVFIQTKGNIDFTYISCKKVTAVGDGFVVVEDSIIISLCKIILVEEVECHK